MKDEAPLPEGWNTPVTRLSDGKHMTLGEALEGYLNQANAFVAVVKSGAVAHCPTCGTVLTPRPQDAFDRLHGIEWYGCTPCDFSQAVPFGLGRKEP